MKGAKTGIRVIFSYFPEEDRIEFIEIYIKSEKPMKDRERILKRYKK